MRTLDRALTDVVSDLADCEMWTEKIQAVEVYRPLVFWPWYWSAAGLYQKAKIWIPGFNFSGGRSLRSTLRHEYGHAVFDLHADQIDQIEFGCSFNPNAACGKDHRCHITDYAQECPEEDFCETFDVFVQRQGKLPKHACSVLRRKWEFVAALRGRLASM